MSKVGIVVVPYITCDYHQLMAYSTLTSFRTLDTRHEISVYAVVNSYRTNTDELNKLTQMVEWLEVNDYNNLSRAWNKAVAKAFADGAEYILVSNLDVILHPNFLDNLISFFQRQTDVLICSGEEWPKVETLQHAEHDDSTTDQAHFSCFLFDKNLVEVVGKFDEQFDPAYHEDSDIRYRIKLAGYRDCSTRQARFFHNSRTSLTGLVTSNDEARLEQMRALMDLSMQRYQVKWGGLPGQEKFLLPYDGKTI